MTWLLPSFPYPPAGDGFWSPTTATLNWCEEDYYATIYSAEIINTLTNLYFVYLAIKGIRNCRNYGHDTACQVAFFNMLFIGMGSMLFHTTLNYWMQLLDELSMIYLTSTTFYALFSYAQPRATQLAVLAFTASFSIFVTLYYHYLKDPLFHQNAFALLALTVVGKAAWTMERLLRPGGRGRQRLADGLEQKRVDARDSATLRTMWVLAGCGVGSVGLGFALWNVDNVFCGSLRAGRRAVGLPWGLLLEGHGWWHIFTALAAYYNLVWLVWLRHCLNGTQDEVVLRWASVLGSLPEVVRRKGLSNGVKKED